METESCDESSPSIKPQKLVHLDLKGAPPKISYYEKIFPLLAKWGATGLLIEYEDMFPYWGKYEVIAAPNCYRQEEIHTLRLLAENNNLMIIPLVQTLGHFEFVLKHKEFKHIREIADYPMTLCPLNPDSLVTVCDMIDQVISLHPGIKAFHIGADEVFHLGLCKKCHQHMKDSGLNPKQIFFAHVQQVLEHIHTKHPGIQPIMWDDMYRDVDLDTLKASGITDLVDTMVWVYTRGPYKLPPAKWDEYSAVFDNVWVASAFKGATGPCMFATDIGYHVENHREWLHEVKSQIQGKFKCFRGFCLTGWQRYDHYAVLCELLPAGLPSLAVCLLTVTQGSFTEKVHKQASADLNFTGLIPLNPFSNMDKVIECHFPGSDVYKGIQQLLVLKSEYKSFMRMERLNGWMTPYHVRHKFTNPAHIKHFLPIVKQLLHKFQQLETDMRVALSEVFYHDTVEEWISCNLKERMEKLAKTAEDAEAQLAHGATPKYYPDGFPTDP